MSNWNMPPGVSTNDIPGNDPDDRALADAADQQLTKRQTRWICPYCWNELRDELQPCCGEVHAMPMPEGWEDEDDAHF